MQLIPRSHQELRPWSANVGEAQSVRRDGESSQKTFWLEPFLRGIQHQTIPPYVSRVRVASNPKGQQPRKAPRGPQCRIASAVAVEWSDLGRLLSPTHRTVNLGAGIVQCFGELVRAEANIDPPEFFSRARPTAASICGGTLLRCAVSGRGSSVITLATTACTVGPVKAARRRASRRSRHPANRCRSAR